MADLVKFRRRTNRRFRTSHTRAALNVALLCIATFVGVFFLIDPQKAPSGITKSLSPADFLNEEQAQPIEFTLCGHGARINCVVDGDTFYFNGMKIRVADIDAPETHPGRCDYEQDLGDRATSRLLVLLNAGPFELRGYGFRDQDRYGRKLRAVYRDGQSLGEELVSEGLAREWIGHREPWCPSGDKG